MNTFLLILLLFIIQFADSVVNLLNIKSIKLAVPNEFEKIYDKEKYKKSQKYLVENTRFDLFESWVSFIIMAIFIFLGGFNFIDLFARSYSGNDFVRGGIFMGVIFLGSSILNIPFSLYETFVIEEKYGFNKTTLKTYLLDFCKNILLVVVIGGVLFGGVLWFFENFNQAAWLIAWIFVTLIQLFILFIAPVVIMPLFNKFTPLQNGELKSSIEKFAKEQNFSLQGVFTMDNSKRSTKSNAFFTGFGKFRRIVLFDTLIKSLSNTELVSVLAHEIGHYKKGHINKKIIFSIITTGVSFFVFSKFINNVILFNAFRVENLSTYSSFVFVSIVASPFFMVLGVFNNFMSRKFEFEADEFAVKSYKNSNSFVEALKKLTVDNLSNLYPHKSKVIWEYSHPPVMERIEAINKLSKTNK